MAQFTFSKHNQNLTNLSNLCFPSLFITNKRTLWKPPHWSPHWVNASLVLMLTKREVKTWDLLPPSCKWSRRIRLLWALLTYFNRIEGMNSVIKQTQWSFSHTQSLNCRTCFSRWSYMQATFLLGSNKMFIIFPRYMRLFAENMFIYDPIMFGKYKCYE